MKTSERIRGIAGLIASKGNLDRPRDPTLSASLRGYARDLRDLADDVAALEAAAAVAMYLRCDLADSGP